MKNFLRVCVIIPLLLNLSCDKNDNPTGPTGPAAGGTISTGTTVELGNQTVGTTGGTFTVNRSGDPLNGLQIIVPQNGFSNTKTFTVSYAPITSHQLGSAFNPITPLIKVSYDGGYSNMPMYVKIPISMPSGYHAMAFFYDNTTGKLEAIPTVRLDTNSITISTSHFMSANQSLGKRLFKQTENPWQTLVVSSILQSVLLGRGIITTSFRPGQDDWEFPNHGSYISPYGHCTGQSMSAIWYFYEKKLAGEPQLFHRYDKISDSKNPDSCWFDNSRGYRFASTIQEDFNFDKWDTLVIRQAAQPSAVWYDFIYAFVYDATPQLVIIRDPIGKGGHAMIVYAIDVSQGILSIADPNYPGNIDPRSKAYTTRKINYQSGVFLPYSSAAKVGDPGTNYTQIGFGGRTAHINWDSIGLRWQQFENAAIGSDRFPSYSLLTTPAGGGADIQLADGMTVSVDTILVKARSTAAPTSIMGSDHLQLLTVYNDTGNILASTTNANLGILSVPLAAGNNKLGFFTQCTAIGYGWRYLDYKGLTIRGTIPLTITTTETNQAPIAVSGYKYLSYKFLAGSGGHALKIQDYSYFWDFGDGNTTWGNINDSTIGYIFTQTGTFTVTVSLYSSNQTTKISDVTVQVTIIDTPQKLKGVLIRFGPFNCYIHNSLGRDVVAEKHWDYNFQFQNGTLTGTTFSESWTEPGVKKWSVTVTMNKAYTVAESFSVSKTDSIAGYGGIITQQFSGTNIPLENGHTAFNFYLKGSSACSHIVCSEEIRLPDQTVTIQKIECNAESVISIGFLY